MPSNWFSISVERKTQKNGLVIQIKTVGQDIELMHKGFVQFNGCSWHKFLGFSEFIFANHLYPKCFLQCFCLTVNSPVSLPVLLHSGHSKNTVLPQKLELM